MKKPTLFDPIINKIHTDKSISHGWTEQYGRALSIGKDGYPLRCKREGCNNKIHHIWIRTVWRENRKVVEEQSEQTWKPWHQNAYWCLQCWADEELQKEREAVGEEEQI